MYVSPAVMAGVGFGVVGATIGGIVGAMDADLGQSVPTTGNVPADLTIGTVVGGVGGLLGAAAMHGATNVGPLPLSGLGGPIAVGAGAALATVGAYHLVYALAD